MAPKHSFTYLFVLLLCFSLVTFVTPQQGATCDTENLCESGCCSKLGNCGFGDEFCKPDVCIGTCNATAECGKWAETPGKECPLNVCCSKWGFCGTTSEFCTPEDSDDEEGCQSNCGQPVRQHCASNWEKRRIAYYESWADTRTCDAFRPEDIPVHALTHINFAFGGIDDKHQVTVDAEGVLTRVVKMKKRNPALQVILAIGGWAFNDEGRLLGTPRHQCSVLTSQRSY